MANQDDYKQLIDATDIVALVSSYNIKLEKQGKNFKGLCPFHKEDTPSFIVSPEKKIAHCFGCKGGGDPITFIKQIENIDFPEALQKLADFNGIKLNRTYQKKEDPNKKYYELMNLAVNFYKANYEKTASGKEARKYLLNRGLNDEIIKDFNIGLAPKKIDTLFKLLTDNNYSEMDMYDTGLISSDEKSSHDFFVNRIMFPIYNENGNPIGFSARIFNSDDKNQPKYINSRESILYHKSEVLFNIQNAKSEIMKKKRVILHEGQMDVIASYKSDLKEAICTMGTALSISQAKLLLKYTNNAIICYDGDSAGINASIKAIKTFKMAGFNVRLVLLPDKMDPDEYVLKYGIEKYNEFFESHIIDALEYQYQTAFFGKDLSDNIIFKNLCNQIFDLLLNEPQSIKESYLSRLAADTKTSVDAIKMDFENYRMQNASNNNDYIYPEPNYPDDVYEVVEAKPIIEEVWNSTAELRLFLYAKQSKANALYIDQILMDTNSIFGFKEKTRKLWVKLLNEYYDNFDKFEESSFIKMLNQEDIEYYMLMMNKLREDTLTPYNQEDMISCIDKIKELSFDVLNDDMKRQISKTDTSKERQYECVNEVFKNTRKKLELKKKRGK